MRSGHHPRGATARSLLATVTLVTACAGATRPSAFPPDPCGLGGGTLPADTITYGLIGLIEPGRAPVAATDAERVVFAQLYETLVRIDCDGRVSTGLAETWSSADDGRRWTFRLRAGATFWDGRPVTAAAVRASWYAVERRAIAPWRDSVLGSVTGDARMLEVTLRMPVRHPTLFAHPSLAVAQAASGWPMGTGTHAVVGQDGEIVAAPRDGLGRDALPALVFRIGANARDLLDGGVDLVIVRERAIIDYAGSKRDARIVPLPWDLTYLLAVPGLADRADGARGFERLIGAVGVDARPAAGPFWWQQEACTADVGVAVGWGVGTRIVYPSSDSTARQLAERLVALGASGELPGVLHASRERLTVAGLDDARFAESLAGGRELAYVFAVPRQVSEPCVGLEHLARRAPWLPASRSHALVDVRAHAVLRRGLGGVRVAWDGTPYLALWPMTETGR